MFISHSEKDKAVADAVCARLEGHRIRCWIAPRDIVPGTDWTAAIINGIGEARLLIVVFSKGANESGQVKREVERAVSKGKIILPFRIEDVALSEAMDFYLSNTHWLDAMSPPLEKHLERLVQSVSLLLGQPVDGSTALPTAAAPALASHGLPSSPAPLAFEYRSEWRLFGAPVVHVALDVMEEGGRRRPARGWIAVGDSARGLVAIGPSAVGGLAFGGVSAGLVPVGFLAVGVFPIGALALGLGAAYGLLAVAPVGMGCLAAGYFGVGAFVLALHPLTQGISDPQAARFFGGWMGPLFHGFMVTLLLLSYLLPRLARGWLRSIQLAHVQAEPGSGARPSR